MPSISKEKLDDLHAALGASDDRAEEWKQKAQAAESRTRRFDDILDKIKKAAQGQSLASSRDGYGGAMNPGFGYATGEPIRKIKTEERQAQEIRDLNEQVSTLRARVAAVVAVAEFAREHKA
jgi:hypothetical protein